MPNPDRATKPASKAAISPRVHAHGPSWTKCQPDCITPSPHQAHCTVCHLTFGGVSGFDDHRKDGWCIDPTTLGMTQNERGIWRRPMSDEDRERFEALR